MSSTSTRLLKFPLPPQANNLYTTVFNGLPMGQWSGMAMSQKDHARSKRVKSREYRDYEKAVDAWAWQNGQALARARALVASLSSRQAIRIDQVFLMHHRSIVGADGTPKKNDTFNRPKALLDQVARLLHVDDSRFWAGFCDKVPVGNEQEQGVIVTLSPWVVRSAEHYLDADPDG